MTSFQQDEYMNELNRHPNKRDPKAMWVWDYSVKNNLNEFISIILITTKSIYLFIVYYLRIWHINIFYLK